MARVGFPTEGDGRVGSEAERWRDQRKCGGLSRRRGEGEASPTVSGEERGGPSQPCPWPPLLATRPPHSLRSVCGHDLTLMPWAAQGLNLQTKAAHLPASSPARSLPCSLWPRGTQRHSENTPSKPRLGVEALHLLSPACRILGPASWPLLTPPLLVLSSDCSFVFSLLYLQLKCPSPAAHSLLHAQSVKQCQHTVGAQPMLAIEIKRSPRLASEASARTPPAFWPASEDAARRLCTQLQKPCAIPQHTRSGLSFSSSRKPSLTTPSPGNCFFP